MKWKISLLFIFLCGLIASQAQEFRHYDFVGAGHDNEVTVVSSGSSSATVTVDGFNIQNEEQLKDASRFLAQCTFGADMDIIHMTAAMGYEAWLEEQFCLPQVRTYPKMVSFYRTYEDDREEDDPEEIITSNFFSSAWIHNNMTSPDILRQRMAFIMSEIFVINFNSDLFEDFGQLSSIYYDSLYSNAFQHYRKLIEDVSKSPSMGVFLSHYNNPKADPANNIHPDENYAREIMQLFSIGLWELNADGTRKYDGNGAFIPTYSNDDIKEFAQVFTGFGSGSNSVAFGDPIEEGNLNSFLLPMKMYDTHHDRSSKRLLNGVVLPAGQDGLTDVGQTLDHLSTHDNTAPFIAKSLIRFLTSSNPSPAYVERIASVFNPMEPNNFQEVIRAILLDREARAEVTEEYTFGKLREPLVRYMNYMKAFHVQADENEDYYAEIDCWNDALGQIPLGAPSVFNFFLPEYQPPGPITQNYMVGPEFQILNSTNSIRMINTMDLVNVRNTRLYMCGALDLEDDEENEEGNYSADLSIVLELSENDPGGLINYLDILLANGQLSDSTKAIILNSIQPLNDPEERLSMALYLLSIAPDYVILK